MTRFPGNPFADIGRTVAQRDAIFFAGHEKLDGLTVDQIDFAKVENNFMRFPSDESAKFSEVFKLKSSGECKFHRVLPSLASRNFQHGLGQLPGE